MNLCFSGHRPNKLCGYDYNNKGNTTIRRVMSDKLKTILTNSPSEKFNIYGGMAIGFDQFMFEVTYNLKDYFDINLIAAVPYRDQPNVWNSEDRKRYFDQLELADKIVYVDEEIGYADLKTEVGKHSNLKLILRNNFMADSIDEAVVLWDGTSGGTANFVSYAYKRNKILHIFNPMEVLNEGRGIT